MFDLVTDRLFKKKKKTGDHQTQEQYNNLKHHTQKITRQAYWKYIENVVTPDESEPRSGMKKFWTSSGEISVASSFRILGDMLSGPGALYGFNCFSNFVIPLQVISKDFIFGCCVVVEFIRFE
jgi:hypothetical protein